MPDEKMTMKKWTFIILKTIINLRKKAAKLMIRLKKISHKKGIRLGNGDGKNGSGKEAKVTKTADDIENQSVKQKVIDVFSIEEQDIIAH